MIIIEEAIDKALADGTDPLSKEDASSGLQRELLEEVGVHLVDGVVGILNHHILTVHVAEDCLNDLLVLSESKVLLLAEDVGDEVVEGNHSCQGLHEYVQSLLEELLAVALVANQLIVFEFHKSVNDDIPDQFLLVMLYFLRVLSADLQNLLKD